MGSGFMGLGDNSRPGFGPPTDTPSVDDQPRQDFMNRDAAARAAMQPTMAQLQGAAMGQGPSVAQAQGLMAQQAAQQQALGAIGAQRGGTGAGGMQAAMGAGTAGMQGANMQFAGARQQEQLGAMQQYQQALVQQRASDLKAYGLDDAHAYAQAQLEQQQNELNTQIAQAKQKRDAQIMGSIMSAIGTAAMAGA